MAAAHQGAPERREGQRRLAAELTTLVHGPEQARAAAAASQVLFGGDPQHADAETFTMLADGAGRGPPAGGALRRRGGGARARSWPAAWPSPGATPARASPPGSSRVNGVRAAADDRVGADRLLHDRFLLVRRGKKRYALLEAD